MKLICVGDGTAVLYLLMITKENNNFETEEGRKRKQSTIACLCGGRVGSL